jgi:hypothetical protein
MHAHRGQVVTLLIFISVGLLLLETVQAQEGRLQIDWGTLGSAELFRFRTTAGVIVHGVEVFTGYEYLDIDRTQVGTLLGGVRIWF